MTEKTLKHHKNAFLEADLESAKLYKTNPKNRKSEIEIFYLTPTLFDKKNI